MVARATDARLKASAYVRRSVLGRPVKVVPPVNEQAIVELCRIGNNVNQVARRFNERNGDDPRAEEIVAFCADIVALMRRMHMELEAEK